MDLNMVVLISMQRIADPVIRWKTCSMVLSWEWIPFALGLLKAAQMIEDGRLDTFVKERYASYSEGIGQKSEERQTEELAAYAEKLGKPQLPGSGRQEYLESLLNQIMFS